MLSMPAAKGIDQILYLFRSNININKDLPNYPMEDLFLDYHNKQKRNDLLDFSKNCRRQCQHWAPWTTSSAHHGSSAPKLQLPIPIRGHQPDFNHVPREVFRWVCPFTYRATGQLSILPISSRNSFCQLLSTNISSSSSRKSRSSTSRANTQVRPHEPCGAEHLPPAARRGSGQQRSPLARLWARHGAARTRCCRGCPRCAAPTAENGAWNDRGGGRLPPPCGCYVPRPSSDGEPLEWGVGGATAARA
ncbi:uncharacterized protein LOC110396028 [Numida meleagris]|uniref:uncharacterized protein LOC110396028 n=1 Tax=Numida meleagris TaxID=8996 RepID=UPI000B3DFEBA|nr:uncharacterized protein LOC110396028 [Numida meleagris]